MNKPNSIMDLFRQTFFDNDQAINSMDLTELNDLQCICMVVYDKAAEKKREIANHNDLIERGLE